MHIQCHFNKQDGDFGSRAVSSAVVRPHLCIQLLLLLTTRWQTCYVPPPSAPLPSAEPNGMWRTVPYSNAAGRKKGFHNLLFLLGERRRWGNGKWTKTGEGEKEMEKKEKKEGEEEQTGDTGAGDVGEVCVVHTSNREVWKLTGRYRRNK